MSHAAIDNPCLGQYSAVGKKPAAKSESPGLETHVHLFILSDHHGVSYTSLSFHICKMYLLCRCFLREIICLVSSKSSLLCARHWGQCSEQMGNPPPPPPSYALTQLTGREERPSRSQAGEEQAHQSQGTEKTQHCCQRSSGKRIQGACVTLIFRVNRKATCLQVMAWGPGSVRGLLISGELPRCGP